MVYENNSMSETDIIGIYSREYVEQDKSDVSDRILISIISKVETPLIDEVCKRYKKVLQLRVDDIKISPWDCTIMGREQDYLEGLTEFKYIHFATIKRFVRETDKVDVHCGAGVSRSSAVAIGIALLRDDKELLHNILKSNPYIKPNPRILSIFYTNSGSVKCSDVYDLIYWYKHKYHGKLSDNSPDYIVDEISLKYL